MKVLLNGLQAGNRSGTGRYTEALAEWLPQVGSDFEIAVAWPSTVDVPDSGAEFIPVDGSRGVRRIIADQRRMMHLARDLGAELIHYPANFGAFSGAARTVVTMHDLSFYVNPKWFRAERAMYYRAGARRSAKQASMVIADSESTAADIRRYLAVPDSRLSTVPLGIDARFCPAEERAIDAVRSRYGLPETFALYMGTIEPRKNIGRLIEAFDRVAGEWPGDLVIAGRRGWKTQGIDAVIGKSEFKARIHFPGFIEDEDQPAIYSGAHAFVWPSLYEGFGLPPLEAMACGTPVMTSSGSSLPEAVGDGAVLVDPTDLDAIAEGLRKILMDETLRATLRDAGRERAAGFTWRRTAEGVVAAYGRAMSL